MNDILASLYVKITSRKMWIATGTIIALFAEAKYLEAAMVAMAYIGVEGAGDIISRYRN